MADPDYDLVVIGAGSGGLSVAAGAAQLGRKVALIEAGLMGGDCLNYGCVPSKALLAAAKAAQVIRTADTFGISAREPEIDFVAVKRHVRSVIAAIEPNDSEERFRSLGAEVIRGHAHFSGPDTVEVGGRTLNARRHVVATGSTAAIPQIPGLEEVPYLTNETIFALDERPEHLIILGGGPVGVEMAQAHRRLGSRVTIIETGRILPKDDPDLAAVVAVALTSEGVTIREHSEAVRVEAKDGFTVHLADGSEVVGSHLLVAAGRTPSIDSLGLDAAGIDHDRQGIRVDRSLRTSNPRVYAIGDCRVIIDGGRSYDPRFTHAAGYEAGIVIRSALFRLPAKVDYRALPWVTYTDPELAHVGLTEAQARERHGDSVDVLRWTFEDNDRAQAERHTEGFAKVVAVKGKVVGASIVGRQAGELIQSWGLAITAKLPLRTIAGGITAYPTLTEVSKRAAGSAYTTRLFSPRTRALVGLLARLPNLRLALASRKAARSQRLSAASGDVIANMSRRC